MKNYLAVPLLVLAVAGYSWASYQQGSQTISLNLGAGVPLSNIDLSAAGGGSDKIGTTGISVGGEYLYYIASQFAVGLDGNYTKFGDNNSSKFSSLLNSTVSSKSTVVLAIAKYSIVPDGKLLPYLLVGFGVHSSSLKFDASPAPGFVWANTGTVEARTLVDDTGSSYAFGLGGGVDIPVNDNVFIGMEVRYQYLGSVTYNTTAQGQAFGVTGVKGSESMVNLFARMGYKF